MIALSKRDMEKACEQKHSYQCNSKHDISLPIKTRLYFNSQARAHTENFEGIRNLEGKNPPDFWRVLTIALNK